MDLSIRRILENKRDGKTLSSAEINFVVESTKNKHIGSDQVAAFLMASYINGLSESETIALTKAMLYSGKVLDFKDPKVIDKHSTGGVGDKTSFILAPIAAAAGVKIPMISGRGLGHTGGTVDKIESITGFKTEISSKEFKNYLKKYNLVLCGQSDDIAPVDKIFYSVRDVTATVSSIPLITASIMSKKLAEGTAGLVLDIKTGSGAFMETLDEARELSESLVKTGLGFNKKMFATITDMNSPLGQAIGNANEIKEALNVLQGSGPSDITELSLYLAGSMIFLAGISKDLDSGILKAEQMVSSGKAFDVFCELVQRQGGDVREIKDPSRIKEASEVLEIKAKSDGYVSSIDTKSLGHYLIDLGGGRMKTTDSIDHSVGIKFFPKVGDFVNKGDVICSVSHHEDQKHISKKIKKSMLDDTVKFSKEKVSKNKLIKETKIEL